MYPNGIETAGEIKPEIPVIKTKSIAAGINKRIKIFAKIETKDRTPVK